VVKLPYIRQTRNPLTPSTITTFVITVNLRRFVVRSTSSLARTGSRQGMKNEYPRLNAFQLMS